MIMYSPLRLNNFVNIIVNLIFTKVLAIFSIEYKDGSIFIFNGIFKQYNDRVKIQ